MYSALLRRGRHGFFLLIPIALLMCTPLASAEEVHDHATMDHSKMDHSKADHSGMDHAKPASSGSASTAKKPKKKQTAGHAGQFGHGTAIPVGATDHGQMDHSKMGHGTMKGFLGPYTIAREGSGTSWVPDTTPHEGIHQQLEQWSVMTHGWINLIYDRQAGPRGADKTYLSGMLMTMAERPLGDGTERQRSRLHE